MAFQCANCGEDLMGAVNRCWRCGAQFVPQKGSDEAPPIRRAPVTQGFDTLITAEPVKSSSRERKTNIRRGSPFASNSTTRNAPTTPPKDHTRPFTITTPSPAAPAVGAALAVVLGIVSLLMAIRLPAGALTIALVGIGVGCWGLTSERRTMATIGLVLCCLGLSAGIFLALAALYSHFSAPAGFGAPY